MRVEGKTDAGLVRKTNQDDFACGVFDGGAWTVVCDGMGGASGGSVASGRAVKLISDRLREGCPGTRDLGRIKQLLTGALEEANADVYRAAQDDPQLKGMGTTVVACIAAGPNAYIVHAGDSRAYIVTADGMVPLTRDHSIVQEMLESGKLSPEEAQTHPQKNIITRALGVDETLDIDFCETTFSDGAYLVVCTDGLTNLVSDADIAATVRAEGLGAAQKLVDMANTGGGVDNITVVVIENQQSGE
jgi:serine/threonine protein phosphatase PrpC